MPQVKEMEESLEDIQEKLWELDKSWQNNLVFYGVKSDAGGAEEQPAVTEAKIREIIKHKLQVVIHVNKKRNNCKPDFLNSNFFLDIPGRYHSPDQANLERPRRPRLQASHSLLWEVAGQKWHHEENKATERLLL